MPVIQFKGRTAVESYHRVVPHHALELDAGLSESRKPSLVGNLIIEGDNLIALKSLLPTHARRIKCIYIDPPYNTGEEGWVYNDNLTQPQFKEWIGQVVGKEAEDATRHDKWCCMMYPRLQLLRELMTEDGIVFASIGEDEVHHLRMMANEVFRTDKPLVTFVWRRRSPSGLRKDPVSIDHEYVLGYAYDPAIVQLSGLHVTEDQYPFTDKKGRRYASTDLTIGATAGSAQSVLYNQKQTHGKRVRREPESSLALRAGRDEPCNQGGFDNLARGKRGRDDTATLQNPIRPEEPEVQSCIELDNRSRDTA